MLVDVAKCQVIFGDDGSPSTTWDIVSMQVSDVRCRPT